jgi:hypothetical protein
MEKYISKEEARQAMAEGKKINHKSYLKYQSATLNSSGKIVFEDGGTISEHIFWFNRTDIKFDNGWYIIK